MSSQSNSGTRRPKVTLPEEVNDEIEERLEYGDSKSAWIREACEMRLEGEFDESDTEQAKR